MSVGNHVLNDINQNDFRLFFGTVQFFFFSIHTLLINICANMYI